MPRASDILILLTYITIAGVAAIGFEFFGLMPTLNAWMMGAIVFIVAGMAHSAAARGQERRVLETEIHELKAANLALAEEFEAAQARIDEIADELRTESVERDNALVHEVKVLEDLVRRVGPAGTQTRTETATVSTARTDIETVREALAANRVDLYLQPVVTLPQRRTAFYESYTRLRDATGRILAPGAFMSAAEEAGLMAEVDNLLLFRCVQIVRRLTGQDRKVAIFCNVSLNSLSDETFFPEFLDFIRQNKDLSGSLIFEISQKAFEERDAIAARNMARMADFGFRFSIDQIAHVELDLTEMERAGVRFAKIGGRRLLDAIDNYESIAGYEAGAIATEDLAGLFGRHGIELIVDKIEDEATVVEVLEMDVAYGQGHLFGEPRPVRDDMLETTPRDGGSNVIQMSA
ncbi:MULTISPECIES: EAL domain-containing protein [Maricaulis]|jgi:cyclic-di-GMP phosphodiesterase TipF (flagellum assembly factor)|uniref:Diguanylate phosphodiesterase n=1 Tax=Maricaulis maris (strain MCS10) TaxID=394221 RepID=Q0AS37_MARMM|nr:MULTISPECIES: EAL domain-containing protein [Maricaulis]ABI64900.1 diguanylate phosphodiesterase [Maricaulis maris MCS10]MAC90846.1 diguanylate phosphodiesterase [Maricaulis sp.]